MTDCIAIPLYFPTVFLLSLDLYTGVIVPRPHYYSFCWRLNSGYHTFCQ